MTATKQTELDVVGDALKELAKQFLEAWPDHTGKYYFLLGAGLDIAKAAQSAEPVQGEAALGSEHVLEIFERHGFRIELGASFSARGQIAQLLNAVGEIERMAVAVQSEATVKECLTVELVENSTYGGLHIKEWHNHGLSAGRHTLYTSTAKPDAELVELLRDVAMRGALMGWEPGLIATIDAKLAEANKQ